MTMPVSVSTSVAHRWVPCGKEKFSGSKVASESSDGSTPSGRLCAANVASAISWMVVARLRVARDREPAGRELQIVVLAGLQQAAR